MDHDSEKVVGIHQTPCLIHNMSGIVGDAAFALVERQLLVGFPVTVDGLFRVQHLRGCFSRIRQRASGRTTIITLLRQGRKHAPEKFGIRSYSCRRKVISPPPPSRIIVQSSSYLSCPFRSSRPDRGPGDDPLPSQ